MIFFDIDNTLTDFSSAEQSALNALYSRFKNTITIDQNTGEQLQKTHIAAILQDSYPLKNSRHQQ